MYSLYLDVGGSQRTYLEEGVVGAQCSRTPEEEEGEGGGGGWKTLSGEWVWLWGR